MLNGDKHRETVRLPGTAPKLKYVGKDVETEILRLAAGSHMQRARAKSLCRQHGLRVKDYL